MRIHGLYAVTDERLTPPERLLDCVAAALDGGACLVQYRDKSGDRARRRREAVELAALCRERGALFIVNDDVDLAAVAGADGVHVGRDDAALTEARRWLGPEVLVGVSCYDDLDRARQAEADGADYIAFGSIYPSAVKPETVRAPTELLRRARAELRVPIVAIGGITAENAAPVIEAGADALAVVTGVFGAQDVTAAARRIVAQF